MKYKGGKNGPGTYQTIINQIPHHSIYAELFAGSAAIFFHKKPGNISILCDISRKQVEELRKIVPRGTIVLNSDVSGSIEVFISFFNLLNSLGHSVFLYLDPPYPISSRSYKKPIYKHEMSDIDHLVILNAIQLAEFPVAISTYKNALYAAKLHSWRLVMFQSVVRGGTRTEYLYMNYPVPSELHDYSYIGSSYREREAISRKINNMVNKLHSWPLPVLNALFDKLDVYPRND